MLNKQHLLQSAFTAKAGHNHLRIPEQITSRKGRSYRLRLIRDKSTAKKTYILVSLFHRAHKDPQHFSPISDSSCWAASKRRLGGGVKVAHSGWSLQPPGAAAWR
ncbi:hypothetical protein ILYODFUR_004912 [Ilyodon furcidens]|uniref:Uncharacterized protein n=1 Tax=Ilyodon furcidens TaxID=33524 RepID=A0ABV0TGE0_9TELE